MATQNAKMAPAPTEESAPTTDMPLFFREPWVLENKRHATASVSPTTEFSFTKKVNSVPLNAIEFVEVAKHYPIVFSQGETPVAMAVIGLEQENMFVDEAGAWRAGAYIPAYVRQYPFALLEQPTDQRFYLCVDEAASQFHATAVEGAQPIFKEDGTPSELATHALQYCTSYYQQRTISQELCNDLEKHRLLEPYHASVQLQSGRLIQLSGFRMINEAAFNALSDEVFNEFRKKGWLGFIYLALASASNWKQLSDLVTR